AFLGNVFPQSASVWVAAAAREDQPPPVGFGVGGADQRARSRWRKKCSSGATYERAVLSATSSTPAPARTRRRRSRSSCARLAYDARTPAFDVSTRLRAPVSASRTSSKPTFGSSASR